MRRFHRLRIHIYWKKHAKVYLLTEFLIRGSVNLDAEYISYFCVVLLLTKVQKIPKSQCWPRYLVVSACNTISFHARAIVTGRFFVTVTEFTLIAFLQFCSTLPEGLFPCSFENTISEAILYTLQKSIEVCWRKLNRIWIGLLINFTKVMT